MENIQQSQSQWGPLNVFVQGTMGSFLQFRKTESSQLCVRKEETWGKPLRSTYNKLNEK